MRDNVLMLAPMVELTHRPMRELVQHFGGCDKFYTEMSSAAGYVANSAYSKWFTNCEPEPSKTVVQFYDSDIKPIIDAAKKLIETRQRDNMPLGGVDINFGCSAPQIEKAGGGVSWMKNASKAAELISGIKKISGSVPISAKLRLGYKEQESSLKDFCIKLEEAGADYLVIHPRFQNEKFKRTAHWDEIAPVCNALNIPIIGNGDVHDVSQYKSLLEKYKLAGIMIGREAVRRPWIFALIRGKEANPDFEMDMNIKDIGLMAISLIKSYLPKTFYESRAKRFFYYFCDNFAFGHHLRYAIQNAPTIDKIQELFVDYFSTNSLEQIKHER